MCTAIHDGIFFGRTLDLELTYGECLTIAPRKFPLSFKHQKDLTEHFAIMGVAHICADTPLYYDAVNEYGLASAALNFPMCCKYFSVKSEKQNIASFELIPWILGQCKSIKEAESLLKNINITSDAFAHLPPTPLHWIFADRNGSIVLESTEDGIKLHKNPLGVMTNSPELPYHLINLANYTSLSSTAKENTLCPNTALEQYSRGLGGFGLPGDFSSSSRFVRAVFVKNNTLSSHRNKSSTQNRFFHILNALSIPLGCVMAENGKPVCTQYISSADLEKLKYCVKTYHSERTYELSFSDRPLDTEKLFTLSIGYDTDIID